MNMMKMCFNPKVLGGLAVVAVGLFVFAPETALAALPVLLALACPLSMVVMALFMGKGMQGMGRGGSAVTGQERRLQLQAQLPEAQDQQEAIAREIAAPDEAPAVVQAGRGDESRQVAPESPVRGGGA